MNKTCGDCEHLWKDYKPEVYKSEITGKEAIYYICPIIQEQITESHLICDNFLQKGVNPNGL